MCCLLVIFKLQVMVSDGIIYIPPPQVMVNDGIIYNPPPPPFQHEISLHLQGCYIQYVVCMYRQQPELQWLFCLNHKLKCMQLPTKGRCFQLLAFVQYIALKWGLSVAATYLKSH